MKFSENRPPTPQLRPNLMYVSNPTINLTYLFPLKSNTPFKLKDMFPLHFKLILLALGFLTLIHCQADTDES